MRLASALTLLLLAACQPPPAGGPPPAPPAPVPLSPPDEAGILLALQDEHKLDRGKIAALGGYGPAAFPLYHRILDAADDERWPALRTLVIPADPKMAGDRGPFLDRAVAFLAHRDPSVRRTAVELVGAVGGPGDAAPVVGLLWDEDLSTVLPAAKALAAVGDRRTVAAIEVWLKRGNHREDDDLRRRVENFQAELVERLKKEGKAEKPDE